MATQLGQEESEGVLVCNANVDCVEEFTSAAESSNHIETTDFASGGDLVLLVFLHPSVLAMVCEPDTDSSMSMILWPRCRMLIKFAAANCRWSLAAV